MKRSTPNLRQPSELKANTRGVYGEYIKHPSKINPIFTAKPWLGGKDDKNGIKI
jgi:hypothetical protein